MSKDSYKITLKKLAEVAGKTPEGFSWVVRQRIREWEEAGIIPVIRHGKVRKTNSEVKEHEN